jgi:hypothetical protein
MSLVPCRECGAQVSTAAETCPHCGIGKPGVAPSKPEEAHFDPDHPIFDPLSNLPAGSRIERHFRRRVAFLPDGSVKGETDSGVTDFNTFEEWRASITLKKKSAEKINVRSNVRALVAFAIGFGAAYFFAPLFGMMIAFIFMLHNGPPATGAAQTDMAQHAWWIAFIVGGILLSGAAMTGLKVGNIIEHASDRVDEEQQGHL